MVRYLAFDLKTKNVKFLKEIKHDKLLEKIPRETDFDYSKGMIYTLGLPFATFRSFDKDIDKSKISVFLTKKDFSSEIFVISSQQLDANIKKYL